MTVGPVLPGSQQSTVQLVAAVAGSLLAVAVCVAATIVIVLVMILRNRRRKAAATLSGGENKEDDTKSAFDNPIYDGMELIIMIYLFCTVYNIILLWCFFQAVMVNIISPSLLLLMFYMPVSSLYHNIYHGIFKGTILMIVSHFRAWCCSKH